MNLREHLTAGLTKAQEHGVGYKSLVRARGFYCNTHGVRQCEPITNPFSIAQLNAPVPMVGVSWPFPQLFVGRSVTLLADKTRVFSVATNWNLTQLTTYDFYNPTVPLAIPAGDSWQFVDFGPAWFLFNGCCVVFKTNASPKVFVEATTTILSGARFRGRLLIGGFDPAAFWSADWQAYFAETKAFHDWGFTLTHPGWNFVYWSSIGSANLLQFFDYDLAEQGKASILDADGGTAHSSARPLWLDEAQRNEQGFMPMEWPGSVLAFSSFNDKVLVCGTEGISGLIPYSSPFPTFGLEERVIDSGILGGCAVGGGAFEKLIVDENRQLWIVTNDLKSERLDGREHTVGLGTNTIVTYDEVLREYHICDGEQQFLLSANKSLTRVNHAVISLFQYQGEKLGFVINQECLNNGTFDTGSAYWALVAGTTWVAGAITFAGFNPHMQQLGSNMALQVEAGRTYELTYTLTMTAGDYFTPLLNATHGVHRTASGTYTELIVAPTVSSALAFWGMGAAFAGTLDSVSLKAKDFELVTEPFQSEGMDTLERVSFTGLTKKTVSVYVDYKRDMTETAYTRTSAMVPDVEWEVQPMVTAQEFRLAILAADQADIELDDIILRFRGKGKVSLKEWAEA